MDWTRRCTRLYSPCLQGWSRRTWRPGHHIGTRRERPAPAPACRCQGIRARSWAEARILESEKHARARGAERLGTIRGFGCATTAPAFDPTRTVEACDGPRRKHYDRPASITSVGSQSMGPGRPLTNALRSWDSRVCCVPISPSPPRTALKAAIGHCLGRRGRPRRGRRHPRASGRLHPRDLDAPDPRPDAAAL